MKLVYFAGLRRNAAASRTALLSTAAIGSLARGAGECVFWPHHGFRRLDAGLGWFGPRGGGIRGNQLLAQHSNIAISGFMNINMTAFIVREQRGCRVVSNFLQGEGDRIEAFAELTPVAELHMSLHVAEVEAMERRYALREGRFARQLEKDLRDEKIVRN